MNALNLQSDIVPSTTTNLSNTTNTFASVADDFGDWAQNSIEQLANFDFSNSFSNLLNQASETTEEPAIETVASQTNDVVDVTANIQQFSENLVLNADSMASMQSGLLSTLGLSALSDGDGSDILSQLVSTSDASLESLQSSLLTNLQSNLFSSFITPTPSTMSSDSTTGSSLSNAVTAVAEQSSILTQLADYSFGDNGIDLTDGFDTVNILQHIPLLSSIYQSSTGDTIEAAAKLGGGFLYGGTVGLAFSAADLAIEYISGTSISDKITNFNFSELLFSADDTPTNSSKPAPSYR